MLIQRRRLHYQVVIHPEEGHLAGFVEEVSKGDERVGFFQVQNQNGRDEGHPLDLQKTIFLFSICEVERYPLPWSLLHFASSSIP